MKYKTIVIDDSSVQRLATSFLVQTNPELEFVGAYKNPFEGIKAIYDHDVDIVLLDVLVDNVNAFELLDAIEINAAVIMNSTWPKFEIPALAYGAIDFLAKPISRVTFNRAIAKAIRNVNMKVA